MLKAMHAVQDASVRTRKATEDEMTAPSLLSYLFSSQRAQQRKINIVEICRKGQQKDTFRAKGKYNQEKNTQVCTAPSSRSPSPRTCLRG